MYKFEMKNKFQLSIVLYILFLTTLSFATSKTQIDLTKSIIKTKLYDTSLSLLVIDSDTLYAQSQINLFYQLGNYFPIWKKFTLQKKKLQNLIDIIEQSYEQGLNPLDYHLIKIKILQKKINSINGQKTTISNDLAKLDILLSDAFLTLSYHYYAGKINNKKMNRDWELFFKEKKMLEFLYQAIQTNYLKEYLNSLHPPYQEYRDLQKTLIQYHRKVKLYPDSILLMDQTYKIAINMERWRWLPKSTDSLFIIVNIPAFKLWLYHNNKVALTMKTIVGKRNNSTPSFNSEISHIILRPQWNIPTSIMKNEILPEILKDTSYLSKNHFLILQTMKGKENIQIIPNSIKWDSIIIESFQYKMIQSPGLWNALGEVKFMFPNQFNVYLHDTNNHSLFKKKNRSFSHGCIRLEKAKELTTYLMKNDSLYLTEEYAEYFLENEKKKITPSVPVSINYWTVWPENSNIITYEDIYHKDILLHKKMTQKPFLF
jgi:murein L,D-transpeptidase YcbB/YkuD